MSHLRDDPLPAESPQPRRKKRKPIASTAEPELKPSFKTGEYWLPHVSKLISVAALVLPLLGVNAIPNEEEGTHIAVIVAGAVAAAFALIAGAIESWKVIASRTDLKTETIKAASRKSGRVSRDKAIAKQMSADASGPSNAAIHSLLGEVLGKVETVKLDLERRNPSPPC